MERNGKANIRRLQENFKGMRGFLGLVQKNTRENFFALLGLFLGWKLILLIVLWLSLIFLPLGSGNNFLGGGIERYSLDPAVFAWANFDGEHYLSIAIFGYKDLEQAFFPVYPKLISLLSAPFHTDLFLAYFSATFVGLLISSITFMLALLLLWDLILIDYPKKIAFWTVLLLLVFPTSFFFSSLYNESLFLLLVVTSFYSARKGRWGLAGGLGMVASATRVFGILLLPALLVEAYQQKIPLRKFLWLAFVPLGLLGYMVYQWQTVGDPLAFYNLQLIVGEQHQLGGVLLPQVFVRYIKMLLTLDMSNILYQTVFLEFISGLVFLILPVIGLIKKVRLSYLVFAFLGLFLPATAGSFSSLPRYILVLFPSFIVGGIIVASLPKSVKLITISALLIWLAIEASLFFRGYWVA